MPHLNELQEKYGERGLTVLGVTGEGKGPTEKWVDEKDARYPYTYDKGGLGKELGVSGIPVAFLIDASGTVVWRGHPGGLKASTIEQHLDGVLSYPLWEWSKDARKAKDAFIDGKFDKAIAEARDLAEDGDEGKRILASIEAVLAGRMTAMDAALEKGDVFGALTVAEGLVKGVNDLPEEERVKAVLKQISKDKQLKGWLKDQRELAELKSEGFRSANDARKLEKKLEKLLEGNEGSFVGDQIEAYLKQVSAAAS